MTALFCYMGMKKNDSDGRPASASCLRFAPVGAEQGSPRTLCASRIGRQNYLIYL